MQVLRAVLSPGFIAHQNVQQLAWRRRPLLLAPVPAGFVEPGLKVALVECKFRIIFGCSRFVMSASSY